MKRTIAVLAGALALAAPAAWGQVPAPGDAALVVNDCAGDPARVDPALAASEWSSFLQVASAAPAFPAPLAAQADAAVPALASARAAAREGRGFAPLISSAEAASQDVAVEAARAFGDTQAPAGEAAAGGRAVAWLLALGFLGMVVLRRVRGPSLFA